MKVSGEGNKLALAKYRNPQKEVTDSRWRQIIWRKKMGNWLLRSMSSKKRRNIWSVLVTHKQGGKISYDGRSRPSQWQR